MIKFIDINTGNVYDGSKPYVHWFDGKQSVGLNYDKQFIIITDFDVIDINLNSEVFYLADSHVLPTRSLNDNMKEIEDPVVTEVYGKRYLDLDKFKVNHLYHLGECEAAKVNGYYVYNFNIIACGKYVGEITDTFTINGEEFTIGADFIDENEALGINLTNFGAEISNEIQRAIYEKSIQEQKVDWVLLNRKFKELLNEYINTLANKGSYKSLINSLNWFEYGDLVKIYEYWRHEEPNHDYLSKRDLTQFITTETEDLLYTMQKTTFVGISCALEKIITDGEGGIVYEDYIDGPTRSNKLVDEPNPKLDEVTMLWSKQEMALKMTLLGNFFATYFMPIHLDLIHSTVEDIVYTQTLKIIALPKWERVDIHDDIEPISCDLKKVYHLTNVETYTNPKTPFGFIHSTDFNSEDEALHILGVDESQSLMASKLDQLKSYALQHFKGIGTVIPFNCVLDHVIGSSVITHGTIKVYKNGTLIIERETENITHEPVIGKYDKYGKLIEIEDWNKYPEIPISGRVVIDFNLLIREIGQYKIQLLFRRSDGVSYIRTFEFEVDDETYPTLKMYKLVPKSIAANPPASLFNFWETWMSGENEEQAPVEFGNIADYVLNPVQWKSMIPGSDITEKGITYMQFISAPTTKSETSVDTRVHTNQIIVVEVNSAGISPQNLTRLLGKIELKDKYVPSSAMPLLSIRNIVWYTADRYGHLYDPEDENAIIGLGGGTKTYYIGINKYPNKEGNPRYEVAANPNKSKCKIWIRDMFVPYLYKLEEIGVVDRYDQAIQGITQEDVFKARNASNTYTIEPTDVVCFLPSIKCIRRPDDFMWKYRCATTDEEITPEKFRDLDAEIKYNEDDPTEMEKLKTNDNRLTSKTPFPTILQPLFGRYDFRKLPSSGYYDVTLNYKLDDDSMKNQTKTISSQFIVKRK